MDKPDTPNFAMLFQRVAGALAAPECRRANRAGCLSSSGECPIRATFIEVIVALDIQEAIYTALDHSQPFNFR